jgi:hypothetical protein
LRPNERSTGSALRARETFVGRGATRWAILSVLVALLILVGVPTRGVPPSSAATPPVGSPFFPDCDGDTDVEASEYEECNGLPDTTPCASAATASRDALSPISTFGVADRVGGAQAASCLPSPANDPGVKANLEATVFQDLAPLSACLGASIGVVWLSLIPGGPAAALAFLRSGLGQSLGVACGFYLLQFVQAYIGWKDPPDPLFRFVVYPTKIGVIVGPPCGGREGTPDPICEKLSAPLVAYLTSLEHFGVRRWGICGVGQPSERCTHCG